MLPFQPPFRNQNQARGSNDPSFYQFPSSSSALPNQFGFNNSQILMPTMGGLYNQNANLGGLLAQNHLIQGLQNNFIASLLQQGVMPQLYGQQLNLLGGLQNPNLMSLQLGGLLGRPSLSQNLNQMIVHSPAGFLCSQNPNFAPNFQLPVTNYGSLNPILLGNGNPQVEQSLSNSFSLETEISSQKLPRSILPSLFQNNQFSGQHCPQMTHSQAGGKSISSDFSGNVASNNLKTKDNGSGEREPSQMRFQKFQSNNSRNAWKNEKSFPISDIKGQQQRNERNIKFSKNNDSSILRNCPQAVVYNESEVQRWREARKKNFPTRAKLEKKLMPSNAKKEDMYSDGKARHLQELNEVLAKQAELGVVVAEIPSICLTEPEEPTLMNVVNNRALYSRFNKKRGRFGRCNWNAKKLKVMKDAVQPMNHEEGRTNPSETEEQTLRNASAKEASNTDTQARLNYCNNKGGKFPRRNRNAKKIKFKKEAPPQEN